MSSDVPVSPASPADHDDETKTTHNVAMDTSEMVAINTEALTVPWLPSLANQAPVITWAEEVERRKAEIGNKNATWNRQKGYNSFVQPQPGRSLAELRPDVVKFWHPTENGDWTPWDVGSQSAMFVWLTCPTTCNSKCHHDWPATPNTAGGCPYCTRTQQRGACCLVTSLIAHPRWSVLQHEWNWTANNEIQLYPHQTAPCSNKYAHWICANNTICSCNHARRAIIHSRTRVSRGCKYCAGKAVCCEARSLTAHPRWSVLQHEWDLTNPDPTTINPGSRCTCLWICATCKFKWPTRVYCRTRLMADCPNCASGKSERSLGDVINVLPGVQRLSCMVRTKRSTQFLDFRIIWQCGATRCELGIERDGEQHFDGRLMCSGDAAANLADQQARDRAKDEYCVEHKLSLLRLGYSVKLEDYKAEVEDMMRRVEQATAAGDIIIRRVGKEYVSDAANAGSDDDVVDAAANALVAAYAT